MVDVDLLVLEKVSRAQGLAEALAQPLETPRAGSTEEVAGEIVELLDAARERLLGRDQPERPKRACSTCGNESWTFLLSPGSDKERCNRCDPDGDRA